MSLCHWAVRRRPASCFEMGLRAVGEYPGGWKGTVRAGGTLTAWTLTSRPKALSMSGSISPQVVIDGRTSGSLAQLTRKLSPRPSPEGSCVCVQTMCFSFLRLRRPFRPSGPCPFKYCAAWNQHMAVQKVKVQLCGVKTPCWWAVTEPCHWFKCSQWNRYRSTSMSQMYSVVASRECSVTCSCITWGRTIQVPLAGLSEAFCLWLCSHVPNEGWQSCHSLSSAGLSQHTIIF